MTQKSNPYIAGAPIKEAAMFVGRQDIFEKIRDHLVGEHQDNPVVIYGQRRTGKTSVLYQMERKLNEYLGEDRYIAIFVDLQGFSLESRDNFLWELASIMYRELRSRYEQLARPQRAAFNEDAGNGFQDFLQTVQVAIAPAGEAVPSKRLLLMFDEMGVFEEKQATPTTKQDTFLYLRSLLHGRANLSFIFSMGSQLLRKQEEYTQLFRSAMHLKVSFLEPTAARALITQPIADCYTVEETAIQRIMELTSGQAYFIQSLCHKLFQEWQRRSFSQVTAADVEVALYQAIEGISDNLNFIWKESSPLEKVVLSALAELDNATTDFDALAQHLQKANLRLPRQDLKNTLDLLRERDLVVQPCLSVALMKLWLAKEKPLKAVREEVKGEVKVEEIASVNLAKRRIYIDPQTQEFYKGTTPLKNLQPREENLLRFLIEQPYKRHTYSKLIDKVWINDQRDKQGKRYVERTRYELQNLITNLRKKIEVNSTYPRYITNSPYAVVDLLVTDLQSVTDNPRICNSPGNCKLPQYRLRIANP